MNNHDWRDDANCIGVDDVVFYPDPNSGSPAHTKAVAAQYCTPCPVQAACLADAMRVEGVTGQRYGIRGGMSPDERSNLARRTRRQEAKA